MPYNKMGSASKGHAPQLGLNCAKLYRPLDPPLTPLTRRASTPQRPVRARGFFFAKKRRRPSG